MTPEDASEKTAHICALAPVIPVLVIDDPDSALPLAKALISGGLPVLEVTLRTPKALEVIRAIADIEGGIVGAGTLLGPQDVKAAKSAGARFGVSPGATEQLLDACEEERLPLLPGAATATEVMRLYDRGYSTMKFFPAEIAGGAPAIKAIGAPIPQVKFCPTGGIGPENAGDYLKLPNAICVGGSWVAPKEKVASKDWESIEALARAAAELPR